MKQTFSRNGVLLVYPPQWASTAPPASMSMLAGALTRAGIEAEVLDLNILLYDHVLSSDVLGAVAKALEREWAEVQTKQIDSKRLMQLAEVVPFASVVSERIDEVKGSLRRPETAGNLEGLLRDVAFADYGLRLFSVAFPEHGLSGASLAFDRPFTTFKEAFDLGHELEKSFMGKFFRSTLNRVRLRDPAIIGISVNSPVQFVAGLIIVECVREIHPDAFLVFGGSLLPSFVPDVEELRPLLERVDAAVYFEGETALVDLYRHLKGEVPLDKCTHVISLIDGRVVHGPWGMLISPDAAAYSFDHLPLDLYLNPGTVLSVMPTRSCRYRCEFCAYNLHMPGGWMESNPEEFAGQLHALCKRHSSPFAYFSCSMISATWAERFSKELVRRHGDICWNTQTRVDPHYTEEVCRVMRQSGCLTIDMGVESLSPAVLKAMHKPVRAEDVPRVVEAFHKSGIMPFLFIMWGFPGETADDWKMTLNGLRDLLPMLLGIHFSEFMLVRGSPAYDNRERHKITVQRAAGSVFGKLPAKWPSQAADEEKRILLREFLLSLPSGFFCDSLDVFRVGLPMQLTHCNAYLHQMADGLRKETGVSHREGCITRRMQNPRNGLDEVHLLNLDTGKHFKLPGNLEPLINLVASKDKALLQAMPKEIQELVSQIDHTIS